MTPSIAGSASIASIPVAGSTPSTCTFDVLTNSLSDKYSSIRQETSKAVCKEDHIGSWERCVESCLALLREASVILSNIENPTVLTQALETGQMKEYLISVEQVWGVCERIQTASQQATTSSRVEEMLTEASEMWKQITEQTGGNSKDTPQELDRKDESEGVEGEGKVCSVCLTEGGHKLSYGGHCYHPPCANLWLNCVDLILPTLTPVTLL
ncbi:synergin gamma-like [Oratosquilla oratoria]|uniref:synergin gamma-like n=1 Tax=Oratosquilla oratoria TaxID=337810 RepID=UPI003F7698A1